MTVDVTELYDWLIKHQAYVVFNVRQPGNRAYMKVLQRKSARNGSIVLCGREALDRGIEYVSAGLTFMHSKGLDLEIKRGYLAIVYLR